MPVKRRKRTASVMTVVRTIGSNELPAAVPVVADGVSSWDGEAWVTCDAAADAGCGVAVGSGTGVAVTWTGDDACEDVPGREGYPDAAEDPVRPV